ncbi:MAG TPA: hypothetical protein DCS05_00495 [Nitrospiraceae bacterium]|nr:hypothetical protein [Nitrospiraceae bacterium]
MEHCQQAVPIAKLEVTTEQIGRTLERLGNVLEKIAEQGTRVETLEENQEILFGRMRSAEIKLAKEQTKIGFIVTVIAAAVSAITGVIVKIITD